MKVAVGDIAAIPVAPDVTYYAQVARIIIPGMILAAAYPTAAGTPLRVSGEPELIGVTFDVLIKRGDWPVVGRHEPDPGLPVPVFVMRPSGPSPAYLEDIEGRARRPATLDEARNLFGPVTFSAAAFAGAAAQMAGLQPWEPHNDPLIPDYRYCEATLLGGTTPEPTVAVPESEHAVTVHFRLSGDRFGTEAERDAVRQLQERLRTVIDDADAGEFDGNEFGGGGVTLWAYGPDADRLYAVMEPHLSAFTARPASATLRYGPADDPSARKRQIELA
jgi:hypothetical protein